MQVLAREVRRVPLRMPRPGTRWRRPRRLGASSGRLSAGGDFLSFPKNKKHSKETAQLTALSIPVRARARTQCARWACGGAGRPSPAFVRGSACRGGSERPACEGSPAALCATHSVECAPAAARGAPPLVATPTGADSRGRGASGRGAGPAPASAVPWCAARCGAQCGAHALGRRPRPLVAGWHAWA